VNVAIKLISIKRPTATSHAANAVTGPPGDKRPGRHLWQRNQEIYPVTVRDARFSNLSQFSSLPYITVHKDTLDLLALSTYTIDFFPKEGYSVRKALLY
jgi:hypothetical protein